MPLEDVDEITLERMREDLWIKPSDPHAEYAVALDCVIEANKSMHVLSLTKQAFKKTH